MAVENSKISVIVPIYNVEPYLKKCTESVLKQTFDDLELLLSDDGSPDRCAEICDEATVNDSRAVVIHKPNGGVSSARNIAARYAVGDYITFIDGDDYVDLDMLDTMYGELSRTGSDIAVCGLRHIGKSGRVISECIPEGSVMNNIDALNYYGKLYNYAITSSSLKLIKRQTILKHPFPTDRRYAEDFATAYKWFYDEERVVSVNKAYYNYFHSDCGISRNVIPFNEDFKTYDEIVAFSKKHKLTEFARNIIKARINSDYYYYYKSRSDEGTRRIMKNDIAKQLKRYSFFISFYPSNEFEIYYVAFPCGMKIYRRVTQTVKKLLKIKR